jgi:hypothetical protein
MIVASDSCWNRVVEVLGSEPLTRATLDRIFHRCRPIGIKGRSYRLNDAKARTRRTRPRHDWSEGFRSPNRFCSKSSRFRPESPPIVDQHAFDQVKMGSGVDGSFQLALVSSEKFTDRGVLLLIATSDSADVMRVSELTSNSDELRKRVSPCSHATEEALSRRDPVGTRQTPATHSGTFAILTPASRMTAQRLPTGHSLGASGGSARRRSVRES